MNTFPKEIEKFGQPGISAETTHIIDIDVYISVSYENDTLNNEKLQLYNLLDFCNRKRAQNTKLYQIFEEFQALVKTTGAFKFSNFQTIEGFTKHPLKSQLYHGDYEKDKEKKLENIFENLRPPTIYEIRIQANLFD